MYFQCTKFLFFKVMRLQDFHSIFSFTFHTHTIHEKCRSFGCIKAMKEEKIFLTKPQSIQAIIYHFA